MSHRKLSAPKFVAALMAAASAVALFASPAVAQTPPAGGLDVVIITANQREEDLQDVAISAAALPTDQIEAMFSGGEDVLAIAARVPGVYAESSNGRVAPRFYIRGLGNTDFDLAASQPVSIIMDDVVMENVVLKSTPLFDLDRVEVYRGPQGTLFGRNTTAGIIRFTSARPTEEFDARAQALATARSARCNVRRRRRRPDRSGRLGARLGARPAPRRLDRQHLAAPATTNSAAIDEIAGRAQLLFTPSERSRHPAQRPWPQARRHVGDLPRQRDHAGHQRPQRQLRPRPGHLQPGRRQPAGTTRAGAPRPTSPTTSAT